jgi:shikimate kinase
VDASSNSPAESGLVLIGYRATGKTTVGRLLAERFGLTFVDCDAELESRAGRSIADIFASDGETAFRDLEEGTIRAICEETPGAVLATGGGAVLRESNRHRLSHYGVIVWLSAPAPVLVDRLKRDGQGRPSLTSAGLLEEVAHVLAAREPIYRAAADVAVDASHPDPHAVADRVARAVAALGTTAGGSR